jgi:hypothetical protein
VYTENQTKERKYLAIVFVASCMLAGQAAYGALLDFSYVSSAFSLVSGRPTQADKLGSNDCGAERTLYEGTTAGAEANAVNVGSPGGYASSRTGTTKYRSSITVSPAASSGTITAHLRVRSSWVDALYLELPGSNSAYWKHLALGSSGDSGTGTGHMKCSVWSASSFFAEYIITTPTIGVWNTYACTYSVSSATLKAYMNGALVGTTSAVTQSVSTGFGSIYIFPKANANMDVKSAYVFLSQKTATQITDLHNLMITNGTPCACHAEFLASYG